MKKKGHPDDLAKVTLLNFLILGQQNSVLWLSGFGNKMSVSNSCSKWRVEVPLSMSIGNICAAWTTSGLQVISHIT